MQDYSNHEVIGFIVQQLVSAYPRPPIPIEAVQARIAMWREVPMYNELPDDAWARIELEVKTQIIITMDPGDTLAGDGFRDWLADRHSEISWKRWVAYKKLLTKKGFSPNVQAALDQSTDEILNCLGDPSDSGTWKRRGLVIGDVQSGKTATYIGAVNKAADAGYKLIVLLAGGTEALRKQTQFRVDEGLIGRDSSKSQLNASIVNNPVFGVGSWLGNNFVSAQGLTTQQTDFRKTSHQAMNIAIDPNSSTPYVFVLKKNKTALENLRDWLKSQQMGDALLDIPMLVVDDESDYASVNTKDDDSPTVINRLIRSILGNVTKSSYLAFTATPFANVFIDHETTLESVGDDLFPRDYIRTLDAPSNYVGTKAYFGTEEVVDTSKVVDLSDAEGFFPLKHKSHHNVPGLPPSLVDAIRTFVVAVAIREARGDSSPRAMLVNVSRFKLVQAQVHSLVEAEFQRIKTSIEVHSVSLADDGEHAEIAALHKTFDLRFADAGITWDEVVPELNAAVHATPVKLINSDRVKQVNDISELESERMIAVGGDVLSRGLTLEGLTVSYFHRSVGASDTLLQMARWFGYRPGYDDLCRVWLTDEVADQFRYVGDIVDELRSQLRAMKKQGLTPEDFGLMVRMHPETLRITSAAKMGAAEAKAWTVDIAARRIETTTVDSDPVTIAKNFEAVGRLVATIESAQSEDWRPPGAPWPTVSGVDRRIVAEFLQDYIPFITDALFADDVLATYIEKSTNPALQKWTVSFVHGQGEPVTMSERLVYGAPRRAVKRGRAVKLSGSGMSAVPFKVSGKSSRLGGGDDIARVFGVTDAARRKEPEVYEAIMGNGPALMIYMIEPTTAGGADPDDATDAHDLWAEALECGVRNLVCVKVAIPGKHGEKGAEVKYMLNSVALNSWRLAVAEQTDDPDDQEDLDNE